MREVVFALHFTYFPLNLIHKINVTWYCHSKTMHMMIALVLLDYIVAVYFIFPKELKQFQLK